MLSHSAILLITAQIYLVYSDSTGHHHQQQQQQHASSRQSGASLVTNIADIDYQMYNVLQSIPLAILEARSSISESTSDTNRDKAITGIACAIGAVSGGLDVTTSATNGPTVGSTLGWLAQHSWGYGYWGPFLLDLQELDPGCGIEDFNKVLTEYSFVTSLYSTYDSDTSSGAYVSNLPDDRPELRAYYLGEFGRKAKLALHCITSQASGDSSASRVVTLIDKYVSMGLERLKLTESLVA